MIKNSTVQTGTCLRLLKSSWCGNGTHSKHAVNLTASSNFGHCLYCTCNNGCHTLTLIKPYTCHRIWYNTSYYIIIGFHIRSILILNTYKNNGLKQRYKLFMENSQWLDGSPQNSILGLLVLCFKVHNPNAFVFFFITS